MNTIVASFARADDARGAAETLRTNGFQHVSAGRLRSLRRSAPEVRESGLRPEREVFVAGEADTFAARIGRLLSGGALGKPVYDLLIRIGLTDREAREVEAELPADGAIVTVESTGHGERIRALVAAHNGRIVAGIPSLPVVYDDFIIIPDGEHNPGNGGARARPDAGTNGA